MSLTEAQIHNSPFHTSNISEDGFSDEEIQHPLLKSRASVPETIDSSENSPTKSLIDDTEEEIQACCTNFQTHAHCLVGADCMHSHDAQTNKIPKSIILNHFPELLFQPSTHRTTSSLF